MKATAAATALLVSLLPRHARAITKELFTTNAVCKQSRCINPIFPGLLQLEDFTKNTRWYQRSLDEISSHMSFCADIVNYDPALPMPNLSTDARYAEDDVIESTIEADRNANTLYVYHLLGMGIESWDHTDPLQDSTHPLRPCARAVARMACYTYFPQGISTAPPGAEVGYKKPCKTCCEKYISACQVECCDESVECVFDNTGTTSLVETGYVDSKAPSASCTGTDADHDGARMQVAGAGLLSFAAALTSLILSF